MKSLAQLSAEYGHSFDYFSVMRIRNKEKFDFIFSFDENQDFSIKKYVNHVENVLDGMSDVLESYHGNKIEFGKFLDKHNLTSSKNLGMVWFSMDRAIDAVRFEDEDFIGIRFNALKKWKKIIELKGIKND